MDFNLLMWFLSVITAGLSAGQMLGELLLIGRFQSWFFETGNAEMFRKSYVLFRQTKRPNKLFHAVYVTAILMGIIYIARLALTGNITILPVTAVVLQLLFLAVFYGSGFAGLEKKLFAGSDSQELGDRFLRRNIPMLGVFALLWVASFIILLLARLL